MNASAQVLSPSKMSGGMPAGFRSPAGCMGMRRVGGIAPGLLGPLKGSLGPPGPPSPPGPLGPPGARPRAMLKVSLIWQGFSCCVLGGGSLWSPGTRVREMTSVVVARVCVDITLLPYV